MSSNTKNMTSGSPGRLIMLFALPLMFGSIFQQFYTLVDTMIVGRLIGVSALAALGSAEWLIWLVNSTVTGMSQGFSILISQHYGAGNWQDLRKTVAHSYILTALLAVFVLIASQLLVRPLLLMLQTPENIFDTAVLYLRILFVGIPITAAYNILASILRAMGNSRAPLIAMIIGSLINIALDLLFVGVFHWGVAGAAAATVTAQICAAPYCIFVLKKIRQIHVTRSDFKKDLALDGRLLKLGQPMAIQNIVISVGGFAVQYVINGYGFLFVAGFTATNKLYGLLELAAISYGFAITTYVGQNLGAGKIPRIKAGVRSGIGMAVATSLVISAIMITAGRFILSCFISGTPEEAAQVLSIAYRYLFTMACFLWVLYLLYVYRSALQGLGNTVIPLLSGVAELCMRIASALILPRFVGQNGIFFAEVSAWSGAAVILAFSYYRQIRRCEPAAPAE